MRVVIGLALALLVLPMIASAQYFDPGIITPDQGLLYQLDIMFDNLKIFLSPDKQSAILSVLNERIAEIEISNGNMAAILDYQIKLKELEEQTMISPKAAGLNISVYLSQHKQILSKLEKNISDVAKPVIEHVINETDNIVKEETKHTEMSNKGDHLNVKSSGSEISIPTKVSVGQNVTIHIKIYNPLNKPIKPVVYIEAKKEGIVGWIAKKNYMYKLPVTISPGQTYEKTFSVTVPESFMGISLEGKWRIEVKVIGDGHTLISEELTINVTK